jgi:hypothetical protein
MNYAVSEFKPIQDTPRRLSELEEARDVLLNVFLKDGFAIACFKFGVVAFPEELEPKLRELVGKPCAILRLDGHYHIREVSGHA